MSNFGRVNAGPERLVVNIIGWPGSGKSWACRYLQALHGFEPFRPSDIIRRYAAAQRYALNGRHDYVQCHRELIAFDPDAMIRPVLESTAPRMCMDGMRAPGPMERLRRTQGISAWVIALECPLEECSMRLSADPERSGHRVSINPEQLRADVAADCQSTNPELPDMDTMFALADFTVNASLPKKDVLRQIRGILNSLE